MPFVAAILVYLLSPQLSRLLRNTVTGKVEQANSRYSQNVEQANTGRSPTESIPSHLTPEYIGDYVEYAGDAAQVLPSTFLVLVGVVAALFAGIPVLIVGILLIASVPLVMYVMLKVLNTDPSKYVRRGGRRVLKQYTYVTAVGLILNVFAIVLVLIFLPEASPSVQPSQPQKTISNSSTPAGSSAPAGTSAPAGSSALSIMSFLGDPIHLACADLCRCHQWVGRSHHGPAHPEFIG